MTEMPILNHAAYGLPATVPMKWLAAGNLQAQRNHGGQDLDRLAERGGMGVVELVAVIKREPLRARDAQDCARYIQNWITEQTNYDIKQKGSPYER